MLKMLLVSKTNLMITVSKKINFFVINIISKHKILNINIIIQTQNINKEKNF